MRTALKGGATSSALHRERSMASALALPQFVGTAASFTFEMLPPPSVNGAFKNAGKKGRVKTVAYKRWGIYANAVIKTRVPIKDRIGGRFYIAINLPKATRGDIDNRVKGILDALVTSGRIDDDKHMDELHVCRRAEQEFAVIIVRRAP